MEETKLKIHGKGVDEEEYDNDVIRVRWRERNEMNIENDKVRIRVEEDRISSLPDEIIHHILSFNDTKYAVQTSVLSSRWKFVWKSLPYLCFATSEFRILPKFSKFVNRVLSLRNKQTEVSSVDLYFRGPVSQKFVEKIASYAMSHNVQKMDIFASSPHPKGDHQYPLCLFSSQSLKHLRMTSCIGYYYAFPLPQSPWNFPALTTLYLEDIWLCDDDTKCLELFSKCVNLKNLTLNDCRARSLEVMKIITPRLENLSIKNWWIPRFLVSAPNLSSFYYFSNHTPSLSTGDLQYLEKVNLQLILSLKNCKEDLQRDAQKLFIMFEELRSAKFLTIHSSVIEFLATVPDLLDTQPSSFSNLKCLEIKDFEKQDTTSTDSANRVINYLLNGSSTTTVIMQLPKEKPKKPRKKKKLGTSKVDFNKRLDAVRERLRAEAETQVERQYTEREAQIERHNAEIVAFSEHIKAETHDLMNKVSSCTTSMAKTFDRQLLLDSNSTTAGQVSTSRHEEPVKEVPLQVRIDGAARCNRLKEELDALSERLQAEREAIVERHKAERMAWRESQRAELDAWIATQRAELPGDLDCKAKLLYEE